MDLISNWSFLFALYFPGDEDDGYDETLIPVDFKSAGQIVDDDVYKIVVKPMPEGVNCTVLVSPLRAFDDASTSGLTMRSTTNQ